MVKTYQSSFSPSPNFDKITVSFDTLYNTDLLCQCNALNNDSVIEGKSASVQDQSRNVIAVSQMAEDTGF